MAQLVVVTTPAPTTAAATSVTIRAGYNTIAVAAWNVTWTDFDAGPATATGVFEAGGVTATGIFESG